MPCTCHTPLLALGSTDSALCSFKYFSRPSPAPVSFNLSLGSPHVTIIRPVKGLEPHLYDCIASSFRQDYPVDKVSIRLCVDDWSDPAYPILKKIVDDFPAFDAKVLVESADPVLNGSDGQGAKLGPNPKVRNISRAYREAKGDIVWIIDCNVWVASGVLGRMVDKLMGYRLGGGSARPYKFVHHLPIVADIVDFSSTSKSHDQILLSSASEASPTTDLTDSSTGKFSRILANGGGRLDELFMATTHAKFYGAINTVGIAPCIVGKSNMFRKSHLDQVTDPAQNPLLPQNTSRPTGVDYFSQHICEDHLIGDLLWRSKIPGYSNHGIVWGDLVVQPMAGMSITAYAARRVRWLRARKFTVLAATIVEPGVESLLCCAYFAFSFTTLPWFCETLGVPQTWSAMGIVWLMTVTIWMSTDWQVFRCLQSGKSIQTDENTPFFALGNTSNSGGISRSFWEWLPAWIGRETMALPIWTWAVLLGKTVNWRGNSFEVQFDTTVVEIKRKNVKGGNYKSGQQDRVSRTPELEGARQSSKDRLD